MQRTMGLLLAVLIPPAPPSAVRERGTEVPSPPAGFAPSSAPIAPSPAERSAPEVTDGPGPEAARPPSTWLTPSAGPARRPVPLVVTARPAGPRAPQNTAGARLAGNLTISVPAAVSLGTGQVGGALTAPMGTVSVDDSRAGGQGTWTATVSSTDYTRTAPPTATIGRAAMFYWSGPATFTQGGGAFTPGQPTAAQMVNLSVPRTAFRHTGTNENTCSWIPRLLVQIPPTAAAGTYRGVITHSVA